MSEPIRVILPRLHARQQQMADEARRLNCLCAGRRTGKTVFGIDRAARMAIEGWPVGWFAPSYKYLVEPWRDLVKVLSPLVSHINRSERRIELITGGIIDFWSLQDPDAGRGRKYKLVVIDEAAMVKALGMIWRAAIRPTLADYRGGAWFLSTPKGFNDFQDLFAKGQSETGDWKSWRFGTIDNPYIPREEIEAARADMDPLTFAQEFEALPVSYEGRAYYAFNRKLNCPPDDQRVLYDPQRPLIWCFDFNRTPGVAAVLQELPAPQWIAADSRTTDGKPITAAVGEVFLEHGSNTERVCDKLLSDWATTHQGEVFIYGDASGGQKKSVGTVGDGSDWAIVRAKLKPVLGERLRMRFGQANPAVRARINAMNTRLRAADGKVRFILDAIACKFLIRDLEGVTVDTEGEIEKEDGSPLSHISDGAGYYVEQKFPCGGGATLTRTAA